MENLQVQLVRPPVSIRQGPSRRVSVSRVHHWAFTFGRHIRSNRVEIFSDVLAATYNDHESSESGDALAVLVQPPESMYVRIILGPPVGSAGDGRASASVQCSCPGMVLKWEFTRKRSFLAFRNLRERGRWAVKEFSLVNGCGHGFPCPREMWIKNGQAVIVGIRFLFLYYHDCHILIRIGRHAYADGGAGLQVIKPTFLSLYHNLGIWRQA